MMTVPGVILRPFLHDPFGVDTDWPERRLSPPGRFSKILERDNDVEKIIAFALAVPNRDERPPCMMLNAPAGSGKSTLLQAVFDSVAYACGRQLPGDTPTPPAAAHHPHLERLCIIPISFNGRTFGDVEARIPAGVGLALRIAERFLCTAGSNFRAFQTAWQLRNNGLCDIDVEKLMCAIVQLMGDKSSRVLLLVDEPGLSWCPERPKDGGVFCSGTDTVSARAVVAATAVIRSMESQVRIVFSSLRPVWTQQGELAKQTKTGGPVEWLEVRPAGSTEEVHGVLVDALDSVPMYRPHLKRSVRLMLALANGHWSTLGAMVNRVQACRTVLPLVHECNVRDVIVTVGEGDVQGEHPEAFAHVLAHSVLGNKIRVSDVIANTSVHDLAYDRVVLNSITANNNDFKAFEPVVSLLAARAWCLRSEHKHEDIAAEVSAVLQSAGNDINPDVEPEEAGIAFEKTCAHFIALKHLAWQLVSAHQQSRLLAGPAASAFFSGHRVLHGSSGVHIALSAQKPVVLQLANAQFFHAGSALRTRKAENEQAFRTRRQSKAAGASLEFVGDGILCAPCVLLPGSKTQPYGDLLVVSTLRDGDQTRLGLQVVQNKFSSPDAGTRLTFQVIAEALNKLLCERGILFSGPDSSDPLHELPADSKNQIAQLRVSEKDVTLCLTVLRDLPENQLEFETKIEQHAKRVGFVGTIAVAEGRRGGGNFFGPSFSRLALVYSASGSGGSVSEGAEEEAGGEEEE